MHEDPKGWRHPNKHSGHFTYPYRNTDWLLSEFRELEKSAAFYVLTYLLTYLSAIIFFSFLFFCSCFV